MNESIGMSTVGINTLLMAGVGSAVQYPLMLEADAAYSVGALEYRLASVRRPRVAFGDPVP